jgi:hypothetical protein
MPLLRYIAESPTFLRSHERIATHALAYLLGQEPLGRTFLDVIGCRATGVVWEPERRLGGGWVDVAGLCGNEVALAIEAKFGAEISPSQLRSYLDSMPPSSPLVLLVPDERFYGAGKLVQQLEPPLRSRVRLRTWEDFLRVLCGAADEEELRFEVRQLEALCQGAIPDLPAFPPNYQPDDRSRLPHLKTLVDQATRAFPPDQANGTQYLHGGHYRFFNCENPVNGWLSLGTHQHRIGGRGLLWLRFRSDGVGFAEICGRADRLDEMEGICYEVDERNFWIGFRPPPDLCGPELVAAVVSRIVEITHRLDVTVTPRPRPLDHEEATLPAA